MSDDASPRPKVPPQRIAIAQIQDAEAYRAAALRVYPEDAPAGDIGLAIPAWHLLCHASELALKAYLSSGGADQGARPGGLKHPLLRHDLLALLELAVERGFEPPSEDFGDLMDWLAPFHRDHVFRYRQAGRFQMATPSFIAGILEPAILDIARTVRRRWLATPEARRTGNGPDGFGLGRASLPEDEG